ncbi:hypothetical protein ONZ45_g19100 [Pleurotus djamor]|nr:hypothetical protein ONZ45_g19100 [Pleurotus djamor]
MPSFPSLKSPPTHKGRTFSLAGPLPGSAPPTTMSFPKSVGLGIGIGDLSEPDVDPEAPLPTFDEQQSMLAVDLSLYPGESRSYTYSVILPENLPPTYKGRTLKFSYELVIGTCRAGDRGKSSGSGSVSRVMKVPIRIYNNVAVGRRMRSPSQSGAKVIEQMVKTSRHPSQVGTLVDLQRYSLRLLQTFPDKVPNGSGNLPRYHLRVNGLDEDDELARNGVTSMENEGGLSGCREAVEILTRNPKKASYDVNKDGVKVAVLTFPKTSYRLGETVLGVVELNDRTGRSRVLKMCALLEAQESLPSSISPPSTSRHLRRVHAEHYSAFVASTLRTTFSLDIPSDASPAFQIDVAQAQGGGGRKAFG